MSVAVNQDHDEHRANSSNQKFPYHQPFNSFQHMIFTPPPSYSNQVYFQPNFGNSGYQQNWSHPAAYSYSPSTSFVLPGTSMSGSADPTDGESRFWLKRLNHMLKVCAGCRGGYAKKLDGSLPDPPHDICISHDVFITLTNPLNKLPFNKQSKEHYHASTSCILLKNPNFRSSSLIIPLDLAPQLTVEHWNYLRHEFGIMPRCEDSY